MTRPAEAVTTATVRSQDGTRIGYTSIGSGPGLIIVGGALRTGSDYLALARALAPNFAVHMIDRRGRGTSDPQGLHYSVDKECEDLLAVQAATRAASVFGHSYGGFVALEAARRTAVFSHVAVWEPGVSVGGSIPTAWLPRYRHLLAAGDTRGAFASFVRGIGAAPAPVTKLPQWYLRCVLRLAIRGEKWRRLEPLLAACAAEHEQEAILDDGTVDRYGSITAPVLLLGGSKSPAFMTTQLFRQLTTVIPDATTMILPGLDHFAPDDKAPDVVAGRLRGFFT